MADSRSAGISRGQLALSSRWKHMATVLPLIMLPAAICLAVLLSWGVDRELNRLTETARLRQHADRILLRLIEMGNTEQAFRTTRDYDEYNRFFKASEALENIFDSMEAGAQQHDKWRDRLDEIRKGANEQRRRLTRHIMTFQQGPPEPQNPDEPLAREGAKDRKTGLDKNGEIKVTPDQLAELVAKFIHEEEKELVRRRENLDILHNGLIVVAIVAVISTLALAYTVFHLFWRDTRRRRNYQSLLDTENATLEQRIKNRTAELEAARAYAEKERRRAELLLQDTSHRIGNSLATVSSLLGLQLQRSKNSEVQAALTSARDRIQTIAAAHRRLRLGEDMETASVGEFLSAVVNDVQMGIASEQRQRIRFSTYFEAWHLASRDVTTLGIILGELLTNAVKHAFPDNRHGRIDISFGKMNGKRLQLIVEDDGVGLADDSGKPHNPQGLGKIVILQLCMQFGSKPRFASGKRGGTRVVIPLPNLASNKIKTAAKRKTKAKMPAKTRQKD